MTMVLDLDNFLKRKDLPELPEDIGKSTNNTVKPIDSRSIVLLYDTRRDIIIRDTATVRSIYGHWDAAMKDLGDMTCYSHVQLHLI